MVTARRWRHIHSPATVTVLWGESGTRGKPGKESRAGRGALVCQECSSGKHKAPRPNTHTLLSLMKSMQANFPCTKATSDRDTRTIHQSERQRLILQEHQLAELELTWSLLGSTPVCEQEGKRVSSGTAGRQPRQINPRIHSSRASRMFIVWEARCVSQFSAKMFMYAALKEKKPTLSIHWEDGGVLCWKTI